MVCFPYRPPALSNLTSILLDPTPNRPKIRTSQFKFPFGNSEHRHTQLVYRVLLAETSDASRSGSPLFQLGGNGRERNWYVTFFFTLGSCANGYSFLAPGTLVGCYRGRRCCWCVHRTSSGPAVPDSRVWPGRLRTDR